MAKDTVSSAAAEGNQPVEPGGHLIGRIWPQVQSKVEGLERMGDEILRMGQGKVKEAPGEQKDGPDPRKKDRVYKPEGEHSTKGGRGPEEGSRCGQRKRPEEESMVPENRCQKLVSQEAERTWDGSATPAVQWGSVPRRLFIPALQ